MSNIFLITAPSGAGKTTIVKELQRHGIWQEAISHTTRPMRDGEKDGETYYFTKLEDFKIMRDNDEFAEEVNYDGHIYGISKIEIQRIESKKNVVIIVEYNGYKQLKKIYPDAVGIFLYMSKEDCMANMLLRGDNLEKAIKRINTYDDEMKNRIHFDYVVKNVRNKQPLTLDIVKNIVRQYDKNTIYSGFNGTSTLHIDNTGR